MKREFSQDYLGKCSNKEFAFACIERLIKADQLDDKTLMLLTDKDSCHLKFCCSGFAVLNEVSATLPVSDAERKDGTGRTRYYQEKIFVGKRAFIITNHWYGPNLSMLDNRAPFMQWVFARLG